jgi:hypothetical protein
MYNQGTYELNQVECNVSGFDYNYFKPLIKFDQTCSNESNQVDCNISNFDYNVSEALAQYAQTYSKY